MSQALTSTVRFLQRLMWILLLCGSLPMMTSCEQRKAIVHDLEERDANEILDFLLTRSIDAVKVKSLTETAGGKGALWDISVVDRDSTQAMSLLNQYGLPRRRPQDLLNIFGGGSLVPSEMTEKIRYQAGVGAQIASTIRKIDGVLDAEVNVSFPEEDPLHPDSKKKDKITASVYVKYSPMLLEDPNVHLTTRIKRLVASSVTGLDYDNVTVILDRARFADIPFGATSGSEEEKRFVSVWSVVVAEESAFRFRLIFFSFIVILLALVLAVAWLSWKFHPLLERVGGFKALISLHPLEIIGTEGQKDTTPQKPSSGKPDDSEKGVT